MRLTAWILFAVAIGIPAWMQWSADQQVTDAITHGQTVCGMPAMAALIVGYLAMVFAGGLASTVGWLDFRDLPRPRLLRRQMELIVISLPLITGICLALILILWIVLQAIR